MVQLTTQKQLNKLARLTEKIGFEPEVKTLVRCFFSHERGNGGMSVGYELIPIELSKDMTDRQIEILGDMAIDLGRVIQAYERKLFNKDLLDNCMK